MNYNLEKRTGEFSRRIISFASKVVLSVISEPIVKQLIRSGTSVGANYMEANQASSRRDFANKIRICQKEANETKYWLKLFSEMDKAYYAQALSLGKEAHELTLIFAAISRSLARNKN